MAQSLQFRSLPPDEDGLTLTTPATAWLYSPWRVIAKRVPNDIHIMGFTFEAGFVLSADDATNEQIFEVGIGNVDNPTTVIQYPHSWIADTRVGFYPTAPNNFFLPEPYTIKESSTVCVRMARGISTSVTYNHVKLFYQSNTVVNSPSSVFSFNNYMFAHGSGGVVGDSIR